MRTLLFYLILIILFAIGVFFGINYFLEDHIQIESKHRVNATQRVTFECLSDVDLIQKWHPLATKSDSLEIYSINDSITKIDLYSKHKKEFELHVVNPVHYKEVQHNMLINTILKNYLEISYSISDLGNSSMVQAHLNIHLPLYLRWFRESFEKDLKRTIHEILVALDKFASKGIAIKELPISTTNLRQIEESKNILIGQYIETIENELIEEKKVQSTLEKVSQFIDNKLDTALVKGVPLKRNVKHNSTKDTKTLFVGYSINKPIKGNKLYKLMYLPKQAVLITHQGDLSQVQHSTDSITSHIKKHSLRPTGSPWIEYIPGEYNSIKDSVKIIIHQPIN